MRIDVTRSGEEVETFDDETLRVGARQLPSFRAPPHTPRMCVKPDDDGQMKLYRTEVERRGQHALKSSTCLHRHKSSLDDGRAWRAG